MDKDSYVHLTQRRIVSAAFGILFLTIAIVLVFLIDASNPIGSVIAVLVIGALGLDSLLAAIRPRVSLIERIGPLP